LKTQIQKVEQKNVELIDELNNKPSKTQDVIELECQVESLKTQITESDQKLMDLSNEFSKKEFDFMDQILNLTSENDELKRENDRKKNQDNFEQKYNQLLDEMTDLKSKYQELEDSRYQIVTNFAEISEKLEVSETQKIALQEELDNKNSYYQTLESTNEEQLKTIDSLNNELTEAMLSYEAKETKLKTESDLKIAELTAELDNYKMSDTAFIKKNNNNLVANDNNLQVRHEGIVCDACFKCPIYGNRYKSVMRQGFDLCEECNSKLDVKDPIIKFTEKASFDREKLEELMPSIKTLLQDIYEGKCTILFNDGFK